jgi:hypothetical protein
MGEVKTVRYFLDIMAPGQRDRVLVQFSTTTPMQAIHVGDILHSQSMLDTGDSLGWLRVVGVVHRMWDLTEHISHLITVYTAAVSEREALGFLSDEQFATAPAAESADVVPMEYAQDVSLEELSPE